MRTGQRRPAPRRLRVPDEGGAIADVGYCAELCDCNADCIEPTFVCDTFDDEPLERAFGRKGVCTAPEFVAARELVCDEYTCGQFLPIDQSNHYR